VADISFKNADGSARNTPRIVDQTNQTDTKDGSVQHVVEVVDVSRLRRVEEDAKNAIEALLHESEPNG